MERLENSWNGFYLDLFVYLEKQKTKTVQHALMPNAVIGDILSKKTVQKVIPRSSNKWFISSDFRLIFITIFSMTEGISSAICGLCNSLGYIKTKYPGLISISEMILFGV